MPKCADCGTWIDLGVYCNSCVCKPDKEHPLAKRVRDLEEEVARAKRTDYPGPIVARLKPPPVAYLHILDNTEGIEGMEPLRTLSFSEDSPFGIPGVDHSESFTVTTIPLIRR